MHTHEFSISRYEISSLQFRASGRKGEKGVGNRQKAVGGRQKELGIKKRTGSNQKHPSADDGIKK
tara:strand:+ start:1799 stop:1993 length:195 start_codon:yes stop_codon:yes gene_type:complete